MKLAIDCRMIGTGGIGTYISSLLPFFLKNFDCLLIGRPQDLKEFAGEHEICNIKTFSLKELLFFDKKILKKINNCNAYYTPYCNIPNGIKIPIYSTIHDVVFLDRPELASKLGILARKWFYLRAVKKSCKIFTVSEFSKQRIICHLHCKKPVVVTYSAVPEFLKPRNTTPKEKKNEILFVGNIKKHKGLHTLLPAFDTATKKGLDAKLVIVGNANNFRTKDESIDKLLQKIDSSKIIFTGKISNENLTELYSSSKLLVQPSLYEGFGLPPLEALKAGTNVLISDIPVFKEIYKDFPVTFFKTEDINDLCAKIIQMYDSPAPQNIPDLYTFEKTYSIIEKNIKENQSQFS